MSECKIHWELVAKESYWATEEDDQYVGLGRRVLGPYLILSDIGEHGVYLRETGEPLGLAKTFAGARKIASQHAKTE